MILNGSVMSSHECASVFNCHDSFRGSQRKSLETRYAF